MFTFVHNGWLFVGEISTGKVWRVEMSVLGQPQFVLERILQFHSDIEDCIRDFKATIVRS